MADNDGNPPPSCCLCGDLDPTGQGRLCRGCRRDLVEASARRQATMAPDRCLACLTPRRSPPEPGSIYCPRCASMYGGSSRSGVVDTRAELNQETTDVHNMAYSNVNILGGPRPKKPDPLGWRSASTRESSHLLAGENRKTRCFGVAVHSLTTGAAVFCPIGYKEAWTLSNSRMMFAWGESRPIGWSSWS